MQPTQAPTQAILHICKREMLRPLRDQIFRLSGYHVDSTLGAAEALALFSTRPYDLAARYEIQTDPAGAVLLKPRSADSDLAWLKLVVSPSGMVDNLSYEDTAGNRSEFRFDGWTTEKARPAEDYRITGPKGTRIVEN